jgi:hypothetical protein
VLSSRACQRWDTLHKAPERPTACRRLTQFGGVSRLQLGPHRHLARPLSEVQHQSLMALDVSATCCTLPAGAQRTGMAARRLSGRQKHMLQWFATNQQRTRGMITSRHQDLGRALPGDQGNLSHSLSTLEARGLLGLSRSPGGTAASVWLTLAGQKWASHLTGRGDEDESRVAAMGDGACRRLPLAPAPRSTRGSAKMASAVRKRGRNVSPNIRPPFIDH